MHPSQRIVVGIPMPELWDERGPVFAVRGSDLSLETLCELLRQGPVRFVVADVGCPLRWFAAEECFAFWKSEVRSRLAALGASADLGSFPGGYCYFLSEWLPSEGTPIVLLERMH